MHAQISIVQDASSIEIVFVESCSALQLESVGFKLIEVSCEGHIVVVQWFTTFFVYT